MGYYSAEGEFREITPFISLKHILSQRRWLCSLTKQAKLISKECCSFPTYARGGPMPLAGAPRDLYTQLLAVLRKELTQ